MEGFLIFLTMLTSHIAIKRSLREDNQLYDMREFIIDQGGTLYQMLAK